MIPFKDIDTKLLDGLERVNYSDLPQLKICPHILDYVTQDIAYHLESGRPHNYIRERINKHILWDLSNKRWTPNGVINQKFLGQSIWTREALLQYLHNKTQKGSNNEKGIQLEHTNERIWYTNQLQALDTSSPNLLGTIKTLLQTTLCVVVTPEFHRLLPSGTTDPLDPWLRYRPQAPQLLWIDWHKERQWSIRNIRSIVI
jgi:hypothetical protein